MRTPSTSRDSGNRKTRCWKRSCITARGKSAAFEIATVTQDGVGDLKKKSQEGTHSFSEI